MERRPAPSGEVLAREQSWQWEGITVLTARAEVPQFAGISRREKRFDRYYAQLARTYLARCGQTLFPRAAEECRAAMARSAPWQRMDAALRGTVLAPSDTHMSVTLELCEGCGGSLRVVRRFAEVWDLSAMLPVPLAEWFPPHTNVARRLRSRARELALDAGPSRCVLRAESYGLTEEGLCILCRNGAQLVLPWDAERGPFPLPRRAEQ